MKPQGLRWLRFLAIPLVALVIGVGVAIASSPASLGPRHVLGTPVPTTPAPAQSSPTPVVALTQPGVLGKAPELMVAGTQSLVGITPNRSAGSVDGGKTWGKLAPPANGAGVAVDPANPQAGITGGQSIQFTSDGGATWKAAASRPPGGGPYQVLEVSPFDGKIWFFVHQGKLLATRDASASWKDIPGLPALSNPVMTPGLVFGEFFLASGNQVFVIDNSQQAKEQPPLAGGVSVTALAAVAGGPAGLVARAASGGLYLLEGGQWVAANGAPKGPIAAGANGTVLVADGGGKLGSAGSISYTFDSGATWHQGTGLPNDQSVEAIAGQPASATFFAYCYGGDLYVSTDGGRSWTVLSRALRATAS
jgi:BNR/Asp-box repeat protein